MLTIHKYAVPPKPSFALDLPMGFCFLSFQAQRDAPQLWVMVDTEKPIRPELFELRQTGGDCAGLMFACHVGTLQMYSGDLVFHLFHVAGSAACERLGHHGDDCTRCGFSAGKG